MSDAEKIAELEKKCAALQEDLNAADDELDAGCVECDEHVCETDDTAGAVSDWLERQKVLGLITPEGSATVQRLLEDLS